MVQKLFIGSLHGNITIEETSGSMEDRQLKSKETYKITEFWEVWDAQVRKLKETIFRY